MDVYQIALDHNPHLIVKISIIKVYVQQNVEMVLLEVMKNVMTEKIKIKVVV